MQIFFDQIVVLEKFPGKGGWTYARVAKEKLPNRKFFGMLPVSGKVEGFEFDKKHLMPMGDGTVFLPISKDIRNRIKKEVGDEVRLILAAESLPETIPEELKECLLDVPGKLDLFFALSEEEQKQWVDTIYSSPNDDFKVRQILRLIDFLA